MYDFQIRVFHDDHEAVTMQVEADSVEEALEIAWESTNNIDRSWTEGPRSSQVGLFQVAPVPEGHIGHRSSMVGDRFCVKRRVGPVVLRDTYEVAGIGFDLVKEESA